MGPSEPLRECREKVVDGHRAAMTRARPIGEVKLFEDKKVVFFCGDAPMGTMLPLGGRDAPRVLLPGETGAVARWAAATVGVTGEAAVRIARPVGASAAYLGCKAQIGAVLPLGGGTMGRARASVEQEVIAGADAVTWRAAGNTAVAVQVPMGASAAGYTESVAKNPIPAV